MSSSLNLDTLQRNIPTGSVIMFTELGEHDLRFNVKSTRISFVQDSESGSQEGHTCLEINGASKSCTLKIQLFCIDSPEQLVGRCTLEVPPNTRSLTLQSSKHTPNEFNFSVQDPDTEGRAYSSHPSLSITNNIRS